MRKNNNFTVKKLFWPVVAVSALVAGAIWTNAGVVGHQPMQANIPLIAPGPIPLQSPAGQRTQAASPQTALLVQEGISQVVSKVRPAVVAISGAANTQADTTTGLTHLSPYPGRSGPVGSGIIIDPAGYVLTTFQTVGQTNLVDLTLFSGGRRRYQADVIGVDAKTDLVLLKIRARETFPAVVLGNSDFIEIGDLVLAIGSPFGFSRTVTMGIVSSNRRRMNIDGVNYPDMIQTDATVNEGNDGGPLVNIRGEVVGVNMAYFKPNNRYTGIGFAIPINDALAFIHATGGQNR